MTGLNATATPVVDAPDVWDASLPPGGYVCGTCGGPVESEPCREHQPARYFAVYGDPEAVARAIERFAFVLTGDHRFRTDAQEVEEHLFPILREETQR